MSSSDLRTPLLDGYGAASMFRGSVLPHDAHMAFAWPRLTAVFDMLRRCGGRRTPGTGVAETQGNLVPEHPYGFGSVSHADATGQASSLHLLRERLLVPREAWAGRAGSADRNLATSQGSVGRDR